jgi:hypothetical protein
VPLIEVVFLGILGVAFCLADYRRGFLLCVVVGFLQDPVRKFAPGESVYVVGTVLVFVAATFAGSLRSLPRTMRSLVPQIRSLQQPLRLFAIVLLLQCLVTIVKTGAPVVAFIGILAYTAPIPALLLAYSYARGAEDVLRILKLYAGCAVVAAFGVYLSVVYPDWRILQSVGAGLTVYSDQGAVKLLCGFMRVPENAAWHLNTGVCMLIVLLVSAKRASTSWPLMLLIPFLAGAVILTGRRKHILAIIIFAFAYVLLLAYFTKSANRLTTRLGMMCLVTLWAVFFVGVSEDTGSTIRPFVDRGMTTTGGGGLDRLLNNSVNSFQFVIGYNGIFGAGAGIGSQGSQHFVGEGLTGGAAEGGLSKLLAELGVPGLALFLWIGVRGARLLWRATVAASRRNPERARLIAGLTAILIANVPVYIAAGQVYGDPFVLLMLGWMVGFVLASANPRFGKKFSGPPLLIAGVFHGAGASQMTLSPPSV